MQYDRRGIAVTTSSPAALPPLDAAVTSFLSHRRDTPEHIASALRIDPDLVVAHAFSGFLALLLGRAELFPDANLALSRARQSLTRRGGTAREFGLTDALASWCDGEMERAAALLDEILAADPLDALSAKLVQSLRFMLGDAAGMRRSVEAILPAWSDRIPESGFILGCHAFALEETGGLYAAEQAGRLALELEPQDIWGCHAVAHVHEMRGTASAGIAWIARHAERWTAVNNFARHMDWHRALFHLTREEAPLVLDIYDCEIRGAKTDDYRDIANAAALLYRLEANGIAVGRRWTELAELAERRLDDRALAFAQLHYLLCLIGDRRWDAAYRLFAAMDIEARAGCGTQARLRGELGVPLAKAMLATLGAEPLSEAARPALPSGDLARLGGSHAQRQTFERILRQAEAQRSAPRERVAAIGAASPPAPARVGVRYRPGEARAGTLISAG